MVQILIDNSNLNVSLLEAHTIFQNLCHPILNENVADLLNNSRGAESTKVVGVGG